MPYKLKDLQGGGLKEDYIFKNKEEIIQNLADYHNQDFESENWEHIYALLASMYTEQEKLDWLCDWGGWEVVEVTGK